MDLNPSHTVYKDIYFQIHKTDLINKGLDKNNFKEFISFFFQQVQYKL